MTYKISNYEIDEFKRELEETQGDSNVIANRVTLWLDSHIADCLKTSYDGETLYDAPFVTGEGMCLEQSVNSFESPTIQLDPDFLEAISNMAKEIEKLAGQVDALTAMHTKGSTLHVPEIISTKEQYEEMKPMMDEEERVLVHTTFDKALSVL